jgi:CRISPR-associated protein Cmr1
MEAAMAAEKAMTVALEAVTPLFLAGAEPRGQPELRPPAFRGALRYWLRAALGGVLGDDAEKVARAEAAVFGSTNPEWGGAGAVTVRIRHGLLPQPQPYQRTSLTGSGYLFWSMAESGRGRPDRHQAAKKFFPQGTSCDLTLACRPGVGAPDAALPQAAAALWLLVHLGGVGSRARRAGGSLAVREALEFQGLRFTLRGNDANAVAGELAAGLRRVREICAQTSGGDAQRALQAPTSFDVLHPDACRIWVLGLWPTVDAALTVTGDRLRQTRQRLPTATRVAFGLPMQGVEADRADRRASPLWLRIAPVGNRYVAVATLFRSTFLPPDARLSVNGQPGLPPTDYRVVEETVAAWVKERPGGAEVRYA